DKLQDHIREIFAQLGIQTTNSSNFLERSHRVMKPEYVDQSKPRDVMICCSSYKLKEQVIKASRLTKLKDPHSDIRIFPDISYHTRIKRKSFANYTKILHQKNIRYVWRYPCKIIVS
ncbi:Hypothetical predicted protein, partial [Pelobates cultripes]